MNDRSKVFLLAWGTVIIWSLAYIFTKLGLRYFEPFPLSVFRYLAAGVGVLVMMAVRREKLPAWRDIPLFILLGTFGFTLYVWTFNIGAVSVSAAASSVIISVTPIATELFAVFLYKEKMSIRQWVATLIEFVGVIVVCLWDSSLGSAEGILWIILSMFSFTVYNLLARFATKKYSALQVTEYSILAAAATFLLFTPQAVGQTESFPLPGILTVVIMGLICSVFSYLLWNRAMTLAETTSQVTNTLFAEPVLTSLLGIWMLREIPSCGVLIGAGLTFAGMLLFAGKRNECTRPVI